MVILDAVLKSNRQHAWIDVPALTDQA
jgi:hypothetical protein